MRVCVLLQWSRRRGPLGAEAYGRRKGTLQGHGGAERDRPVTVPL